MYLADSFNAAGTAVRKSRFAAPLPPVLSSHGGTVCSAQSVLRILRTARNTPFLLVAQSAKSIQSLPSRYTANPPLPIHPRTPHLSANPLAPPSAPAPQRLSTRVLSRTARPTRTDPSVHARIHTRSRTRSLFSPYVCTPNSHRLSPFPALSGARLSVPRRRLVRVYVVSGSARPLGPLYADQGPRNGMAQAKTPSGSPVVACQRGGGAQGHRYIRVGGCGWWRDGRPAPPGSVPGQLELTTGWDAAHSHARSSPWAQGQARWTPHVRAGAIARDESVDSRHEVALRTSAAKGKFKR
ncbi:hypothetical protein BDY21DRAFT_400248 [Lineolata rhizophorae]|uniref:Uncharacterized protein n=1 Tax=Lineolata rhizophorae TaxID=578093 RepID=A0A6A6NSP1_9PEZI|nr:hypothetical protein BDY21DRAFT_400248 [Lineolata rhizophorae]